MNKASTSTPMAAGLTRVKPVVVSSIATLDGSGGEALSEDLDVLVDLLNATSKLRVIVETYDPVTGFYRLALCGRLTD